MPTIELSTVYFYRGKIAREIALKDCSFPIAQPPRQALCALYGTQGKQDGLVAARGYAASQGLTYTVVDMLVDLDDQNPLVMKPADLSRFDFLNFSRVSRALATQLSARLAGRPGGANADSPSAADLAEQPLRAVLGRFPALMEALLELDECRHLKVVACQVATLAGSRPITIGWVPHRHWSAIREATCRLDPDVRVSLDAPD